MRFTAPLALHLKKTKYWKNFTFSSKYVFSYGVFQDINFCTYMHNFFSPLLLAKFRVLNSAGMLLNSIKINKFRSNISILLYFHRIVNMKKLYKNKKKFNRLRTKDPKFKKIENKLFFKARLQLLILKNYFTSSSLIKTIFNKNLYKYYKKFFNIYNRKRFNKISKFFRYRSRFGWCINFSKNFKGGRKFNKSQVSKKIKHKKRSRLKRKKSKIPTKYKKSVSLSTSSIRSIHKKYLLEKRKKIKKKSRLKKPLQPAPKKYKYKPRAYILPPISKRLYSTSARKPAGYYSDDYRRRNSNAFKKQTEDYRTNSYKNKKSTSYAATRSRNSQQPSFVNKQSRHSPNASYKDSKRYHNSQRNRQNFKYNDSSNNKKPSYYIIKKQQREVRVAYLAKLDNRYNIFSRYNVFSRRGYFLKKRPKLISRYNKFNHRARSYYINKIKYNKPHYLNKRRKSTFFKRVPKRSKYHPLRRPLLRVRKKKVKRTIAIKSKTKTKKRFKSSTRKFKSFRKKKKSPTITDLAGLSNKCLLKKKLVVTANRLVKVRRRAIVFKFKKGIVNSNIVFKNKNYIKSVIPNHITRKYKNKFIEAHNIKKKSRATKSNLKKSKNNNKIISKDNKSLLNFKKKIRKIKKKLIKPKKKREKRLDIHKRYFSLKWLALKTDLVTLKKKHKTSRLNTLRFFFSYYPGLLLLKRFINKAAHFFFKNLQATINSYLFIMKRSIPSADIISYYMIGKLKRRFKAGTVYYFVLDLLKRYKACGHLSGYKLVMQGRFSRRDRATYLTKNYKLPITSKLKKIEFSYRTLVLKYGLCSLKLWILL